MRVYTERYYPPMVRHDTRTFIVKVRDASGCWRYHDSTHASSAVRLIVAKARREFGDRNVTLEVVTK